MTFFCFAFLLFFWRYLFFFFISSTQTSKIITRNQSKIVDNVKIHTNMLFNVNKLQNVS